MSPIITFIQIYTNMSLFSFQKNIWLVAVGYPAFHLSAIFVVCRGMVGWGWGVVLPRMPGLLFDGLSLFTQN